MSRRVLILLLTTSNNDMCFHDKSVESECSHATVKLRCVSMLDFLPASIGAKVESAAKDEPDLWVGLHGHHLDSGAEKRKQAANDAGAGRVFFYTTAVEPLWSHIQAAFDKEGEACELIRSIERDQEEAWQSWYQEYQEALADLISDPENPEVENRRKELLNSRPVQA